MEKIFIYTFLVILISCGVELSPNRSITYTNFNKSDIEKLKKFDKHPVLFYNVENLFDTINDPKINDDEFTPTGSKEWSRIRYEDKLSKLSKVITAANDKTPLFIGLAEIENRATVKDLTQTDKLSKTKYGIAHYDSPDRRGIDVALAYDLDRFLLLYSEAITIKMKGNSQFKTRDILYVKGLLKDSIQLHMFVNHWPSRYGGQKESEHKRVLAARTLKAKSDSILANDADANIIIMGDFNDYPTNKSITKILGAKSINASKEYGFVNLLAPQHSEGTGTYNYKGEWGVLDQIIISAGLKEGKTLSVKDNKAYILKKDFLLYEHNSGDTTPNRTYGGSNYYGGYSDHLAVYTFLESARN